MSGFRYINPTTGLQSAIGGMLTQEQRNKDNLAREQEANALALRQSNQATALASHQDKQRGLEKRRIDATAERDALTAKAKNLQIANLERANTQRVARENVERGLLGIAPSVSTPITEQVSTGYANDPTVQTYQDDFNRQLSAAISKNQEAGTPTPGYADARKELHGKYSAFMTEGQKQKSIDKVLEGRGIKPTTKLSDTQVVENFVKSYEQDPTLLKNLEQAQQFKTVETGKFTDVTKTPAQLYKEQIKLVNADKTLDAKTKREILARLDPDPKLTFDQTLGVTKTQADVNLKKARTKQIIKDTGGSGTGRGFKFGTKAAGALADTDFDLDDAENMNALQQIFNDAKAGGLKLDDALVEKLILSADDGWTFTDSGQLQNIKKGVEGLLRAEQARKQ